MKCILDTVQILKIAVSLSILDTVSKILPNPEAKVFQNSILHRSVIDYVGIVGAETAQPGGGALSHVESSAKL